MATLSLTVVEIIVLMLGAIVLGITIHFFIVSRRSFRTDPAEARKNDKNLEEWKLKYFNELESREKELSVLKRELEQTRENNEINTIEAEEMRFRNKALQQEIDGLRKTTVFVPAAAPIEKPGYMEQLRQAQSGLQEHNEKINQLLAQIDIVKENEEKQQEILKNNEELSEKITELSSLLDEKEKEVDNVRRKANITQEMNAILDSAYSEFNVLQSKMQKLESEVNSSRMLNMDYEDLKEAHYKMVRDFDDNKQKLHASATDIQQLQIKLIEAEEKLRETHFQRQQLQKRVAYLEELNHDLQSVSDANKKLEGQIKRIGELESMLNVIAEERDQLAQRHVSGMRDS